MSGFFTAAARGDEAWPVAQAEVLVVVSDFDGTLAEFSADPMNVPINAVATRALYDLAALAGTSVTILSGRDLAALGVVSGLQEPIALVGSHGAETSVGGPSPEQERQLADIAAVLEPIAARHEGAFVEVKPYHRVLHVRQVPDELAAELIDAAAAVDPGGLTRTFGKKVLEFGVTDITKGTWLAQEVSRQLGRLPQAAPAGTLGVVFLGDDRTDEDGFEALAQLPADERLVVETVKVGAGDTAATVRVEDVQAVGAYLRALADARLRRR